MTNSYNSTADEKTEKYNFAFRSIILVLSFGILSMTPFYIWGFPKGADFDNHFRFVLPLYDEIMKGNFFPGWLAESNYGYGDPRFSFYPPFLYYILCLFRYLTGSWFAASSCTFTLFSVIASLGMYLWARRSFSDSTAIIAALIFSFAPYRMAQFYQASLLAEFAATSLLPFAFLAVERLMTERQAMLSSTFTAIGGLAAVYSVIVTTHLPTTVILSFSLGLFALASTDWKTNKRGLLYCGAGIFLGLFASAWFLVRMLSELSWIQAGSGPVTPYYDYRNNFVFSPFALTNLNTFYGSVITALTIGLFLPSLILWKALKRKQNDKGAISGYVSTSIDIARRRLAVIILLALFVLLMTTDLSRPIWAVVPKLKDVQFPFRWLAVVSVLICPPIAVALQMWAARWREGKIRAYHLPIVLFFFIAVVMSFQQLVWDSEFLPRKESDEHFQAIRGARSFMDWLPAGAKELKDLPPLNGLAEAGGRHVTIKEWESHHRLLTIEPGEETILRIRSYMYPNWNIHVSSSNSKDSQASLTETGRRDIPEDNSGTISIPLPKEETTVSLDFTESSRVAGSRYLAALIWIILFAFLLAGYVLPKRASGNNGQPGMGTGA